MASIAADDLWPKRDPITNRWICMHCWEGKHHPEGDVNCCRCVCRDLPPPKVKKPKGVQPELLPKPQLRWVEGKG
jgi:hypothetical protein